jgi:hypothetical protein
MLKHKFRISIFSAMLMVAAMIAINHMAFAADCTSNDATEPCFSNNNDILSGSRELLPVDDLHVTVQTKSDSESDVGRYYLKTKELAIDNTITSTDSKNCGPPFQSLSQSLIGRIFATPNDILANMEINTVCSQLILHLYDELDSGNNSFVVLESNAASITYAGLGMGDFNKDGYQDILYVSNNAAQAWTARCTGDPFNACTEAPSAGLIAGPVLSLSTNGPYAGAPVTGDFNGDGIVDAAWPAYDNSDKLIIEMVSVCPAAGAVVSGTSCSQPFQVLPLKTINLNASLNLTGKNLSRPTVDIGAGNFDGAIDTDTGRADDELVVALADSNNSFVTVAAYDYDAGTGNMVSKDSETFDIEHNEDNGAQVFVEGVQLDPNSQRYQAAFSYTKSAGSVPHRGVVTVISFDDNLNMTVSSTTLANNSKTRIFGMAVGRFDPPNSIGGDIDFANQIALLISHDDSDTQIQIFSAPPITTFTPTEESRINITSDTYEKDSMQLSALSAGDLQGRSLILGEPDKITVSSTQVDVVVGLPPMHVDFIEPVGGGEPTILNVSVFPETFNAGFDFDQDSGTTSSHEGTTGYSGAWKESIEFTQKYGTSTNGETFRIKFSADQSYERNVTKTRDSYSGQSYSLSSETLFDDLVVGTSTRMNIYSYPVIGQFDCPEESPNCDLNCTLYAPGCDKKPLMIQFSGPDNIVYTSPAEAGGMEWYQPVTEPGNVFSYPGSLALLKANESLSGTATDIDLLTPSNSVWDSQEPEEVSVQWTGGGGRSKSIDITKEFSFGLGGSLKGSEGVKGVESTSVKLKLSTEQSGSFGNLNTTGHEWAASTGVTLKRGLGPAGNSSDDNLLYQGATFIYGLNATVGTIAPDLGAPSSETNVATHGPFKVGHVANVLSTSLPASGNWWRQAYTVAPDLAFNHPQRWLQRSPEGSVPQQVRFNCPIGFESDFEEPEEDPGSCVANENEPNTSNLATAAFYKMKGLFVTAGDSETGPASSLATLGDILKLQARVYNYSLANMPNGATAHVRFYAQPWDSTHATFAGGNGKYGFADAIYIGEQILFDPVPAYCGGSQGFDSCSTETVPNWVMATVQWDTSTLSPQPIKDTEYKFWVVVWMEDSNGNLLDEIDGHGLTAIPDPAVASFAEIPVETYSNNLGFYNQTFSLLLPDGSTPEALNPEPVERRLAINALEIELERLKKHEQSMVRVHYQASGERYDDVKVLLFEGDSADGQLLDMELIPRMGIDEPTVVALPYIPRTCGAHSLFVQTFQNDGTEPVTETIAFDVPCEPTPIVHFKGEAKFKDKYKNKRINRHENYYHDWHNALELKGQFTLERAHNLPGIDLASQVAQVTLYSLLDEVGENGELVENLPVVLYVHSRNSEDSAVYETLPGEKPAATLRIEAHKKYPGTYSFKLKLNKADIARPDGCPRTSLLTSFTIEDGGAIPVHPETEALWRCNGKSGTMTTKSYPGHGRDIVPSPRGSGGSVWDSAFDMDD